MKPAPPVTRTFIFFCERGQGAREEPLLISSAGRVRLKTRAKKSWPDEKMGRGSVEQGRDTTTRTKLRPRDVGKIWVSGFGPWEPAAAKQHLRGHREDAFPSC
eukprot:scaffold53409_cov22-Phaeocystis_antarctica.AAC.1